MDLFKVGAIFLVILLMLNGGIPLFISMICGTALTAVIYMLPPGEVMHQIGRTLTDSGMWSVVISMYVICVLIEELKLRSRFDQAQGAMIACSISRIPIPSFIILSLPLLFLNLFCTYLVYMRRVPKCETAASGGAGKSIRILFRSLWTLLLSILIITVFNLETWPVVAVVALLNVFVDRLSPAEFRLSVLGGTYTAVAAFLGLARTMIPAGDTILVVSLMGISYAASQISPTHICTPIISEYFHVTFLQAVRKMIPMLALYCAGVCVYYLVMSAIL